MKSQRQVLFSSCNAINIKKREEYVGKVNQRVFFTAKMSAWRAN